MKTKAVIELRLQANYWKAQHARTVEREKIWKEKVERLTEIVNVQEKEIVELREQNEALKAKVAQLQQQVFGQKTEQIKREPECEKREEIIGPLPSVRRKRGKQIGARGYGRKYRENLPTEEIYHDLLPEEKCCPKCGKSFEVFPGTDNSEEIHWEVKLVRRIHKRCRYRPTCDCKEVPGILAAAPAAKLIKKGMFSTGFWVFVITEKFLLQMPLYRIRQRLEYEGLYVSQGTLTGGLMRIAELLQPLYVKILERSRTAKHWHMDETRWMVFAEVEGKIGHRWWLWVVVTQETCCYLLEPSRSSAVILNHLGENAQGIISADRYSAYKAVEENIPIAFCWAHVRRDFIKVRDCYQKLQAWAQEWIARINDLFYKNQERVKMLSDLNAFSLEQQKLKNFIEEMACQYKRELGEPDLHPAKRKVLESLANHWHGLILFVLHPHIPMDNNEAERRLRNPVVGRKNYYGSGSLASGTLAAILFTIFQTMIKNHIDPQKFLLAYFDACAQNGGLTPENPERFLPWNLADEQKEIWLHKKPT